DGDGSVFPDVIDGDDEQRAVDVGQAGVILLGAVGEDPLDGHGAGVGAVALPQYSVVGHEVERPVDAGHGRVGTHCQLQLAAGADVLNQDGARVGAVALPQFPSVAAVVGDEEQRPAHGGQVPDLGPDP